jgi:hypothetical protein
MASFNPFTVQTGPQANADSHFGFPRGGARGELIYNQLNGKYYEQARRGNVFIARTAIAGVVIPIYTSVTPLFPLWNVSCDKNLVPMRLTIACLGTPAVQGEIVFAIVYPGPAIGVPVTAFTEVDLLNAGTLRLVRNAAVRFGSTATIVAPAVWMNTGITSSGVFAAATATAPFGILGVDFDGSFVVPPGCLIAVSGNVAQTAAFSIQLSFSIEPVQPGLV